MSADFVWVEEGFPLIYADSLRDCKPQMSADFVWKGINSDSIGIREDLSPSLSPQEKGRGRKGFPVGVRQFLRG
jgi:hypothetical protein